MPSNLKKDSDIVRGDFDYRFSSSEIGIFKWKDNEVCIWHRIIMVMK